uniref:Uncharacterized protein n=1 Tax=Oryza glaberrima TaxID=4538 RepID=I1NT70_ORYGL
MFCTRSYHGSTRFPSQVQNSNLRFNNRLFMSWSPKLYSATIARDGTYWSLAFYLRHHNSTVKTGYVKH